MPVLCVRPVEKLTRRPNSGVQFSDSYQLGFLGHHLGHRYLGHHVDTTCMSVSETECPAMQPTPQAGLL